MRRRQRRAAIVLAVLFVAPAIAGVTLATTGPPSGCWEWCDLNAAYGRFVLGFALGGLALAAGTWRGNLFCMGVALFIFVMGVLIAGFFAVTIAASGRMPIAALISFAVAIVLAVPVALLSMALIAEIKEGRPS